jgi:hypothetical protein
MIPPIGLLLSVEMIRDGGSLAAEFQCADAATYWLFFPLRMQELASGEIERLGYGQPIISCRIAGTSTEISWDHALALLNQMEPLLRDESHREWLDAMRATARGGGALPPRIVRSLGIPRRLV